MSDYEVSREELFAELKNDLQTGKTIVWKKYKIHLSKPMDKEEFAISRKSLEMTQTQLAQILDIPVELVKEYEQGETVIPGLIAKVLRKMENKVFRELFISESVTVDTSENVIANKEK